MNLDALDDVLADWKASAKVSRTRKPVTPSLPAHSATSSRGSMDFRVELSDQAQRDITAI